MRNHFTLLVFMLCCTLGCASQKTPVAVKKSAKGFYLEVRDTPFFIKGMNWDYYPIGTNYSYNFWQQPDSIITLALENEMKMLAAMGVNTIRQYTGVPAKWIEYIYKNYGIFTVLNHSFGRYGLNLNNKWEANTDYSQPLVKEVLLNEVKDLAWQYKNTQGLLMFLLGNENNYGLFWQGAETENIPMQDRKSTIAAKHLYALFNEAVLAMKNIDSSHPIAICNGDLLFLDILATECTAADILGINIYRGLSFGDAFEKVKKVYNKPVMLTELGADAFNERTKTEDQASQAKYLVSNWKEMYENTAGNGKADNCIGGFTFQFSDGWWKAGQTINLKVHDSTASWSNGGYQEDYEKGQNNMNEEWFGICAKGPANNKGIYTLQPRSAYFALQQLFRRNPYSTDGKPAIKN